MPSYVHSDIFLLTADDVLPCSALRPQALRLDVGFRGGPARYVARHANCYGILSASHSLSFVS
jgi:hypothetical protein